eukprot:16431842-Heterocapsa_arctica.AAC.1
MATVSETVLTGHVNASSWPIPGAIIGRQKSEHCTILSLPPGKICQDPHCHRGLTLTHSPPGHLPGKG